MRTVQNIARMSITDDREDILDSGTLTVGAFGSANSPWVSTEGYSQVVLIGALETATSLMLQESNDKETVLFTSALSADGLGHYKGVVTPGTAFVSANVGGSAEGQTATYSIRGIR